MQVAQSLIYYPAFSAVKGMQGLLCVHYLKERWNFSLELVLLRIVFKSLYYCLLECCEFFCLCLQIKCQVSIDTLQSFILAFHFTKT